MRFEAVLFDLDGTVVDSGAIILASMRHATREVLGSQEVREAYLGSFEEGAKGPRLYDWAYLPHRAAEVAPGWQKGLLVRRKIKKPEEFTFYLTLSPTGNTLGRTGAGGRHALDRRELL